MSISKAIVRVKDDKLISIEVYSMFSKDYTVEEFIESDARNGIISTVMEFDTNDTPEQVVEKWGFIHE